MKPSRPAAQPSPISLNVYAYLLPSLNVLQFLAHPWLYSYVRDVQQQDDQQGGFGVLFITTFIFFIITLFGFFYAKKIAFSKLKTLYKILLVINALFTAFYWLCIAIASTPISTN